MRAVKKVLQRLGLFEVGLEGRDYTRCNMGEEEAYTRVKLDNGFGNLA